MLETLGELPFSCSRLHCQSQQAGIAVASNKTASQIVLDYGMKTMYCVTTSTKGTYTTPTVAFGGEAPAQVVFHSTYNNADRRCWFDNVKVQNIAAGAVRVVQASRL